MATLDELAARVARLEALAAGVSEAAVPNYLTVDPATGQVGALFQGGIQIPEGVGPNPSSHNAVAFVDAGGTVQEWLGGFNEAGEHFLGAQMGVWIWYLGSSAGRSTFVQVATPNPENITFGDPAAVLSAHDSTAAAPSGALFGPLELAGVTRNVLLDPGGRIDATTGQYTCRNTGIYLAFGAMAWNPVVALTAALGAENLTTGELVSSTAAAPASANPAGVSFTSFVRASAGDKLRMVAQMTTGEIIRSTGLLGIGTYFGVIEAS